MGTFQIFQRCKMCGEPVVPDFGHTCVTTTSPVPGLNSPGIDTGEIHRGPLLKEIADLEAQLAEKDKKIDQLIGALAESENHAEELESQLYAEA